VGARGLLQMAGPVMGSRPCSPQRAEGLLGGWWDGAHRRGHAYSARPRRARWPQVLRDRPARCRAETPVCGWRGAGNASAPACSMAARICRSESPTLAGSRRVRISCTCSVVRGGCGCDGGSAFPGQWEGWSARVSICSHVRRACHVSTTEKRVLNMPVHLSARELHTRDMSCLATKPILVPTEQPTSIVAACRSTERHTDAELFSASRLNLN
jgi:hypothetical protein